jgi:hypothetical protein
MPIHVKYEGKFWGQKDKAHVKGQKKNAPLMFMSLLVFLGTTARNLTALGSHSVHAFKATHSRFI